MTISGIMEVADNLEGTSVKLTPEQLRARRARSIAIALALGAFVLVIFAATIVRLGSGALTMRPVAARATVGQSDYNASQPTVGIYFEKINCFRFNTQTMQPGETRDMAVVFYVDPKLADDSEQGRFSTITLSYTAREPDAPVNESAVPGKSGSI